MRLLTPKQTKFESERQNLERIRRGASIAKKVDDLSEELERKTAELQAKLQKLQRDHIEASEKLHVVRSTLEREVKTLEARKAEAIKPIIVRELEAMRKEEQAKQILTRAEQTNREASEKLSSATDIETRNKQSAESYERLVEQTATRLNDAEKIVKSVELEEHNARTQREHLWKELEIADWALNEREKAVLIREAVVTEEVKRIELGKKEIDAQQRLLSSRRKSLEAAIKKHT